MPTIHLGQKVHQQEQRGIQTIRGDYNRQIEAYNQELEDMKKQLESEKYRQDIERLKAEKQEKEKEQDRERIGRGKPPPYHQAKPRSYEDCYKQPNKEKPSIPTDRYHEAMERRRRERERDNDHERQERQIDREKDDDYGRDR